MNKHEKTLKGDSHVYRRRHSRNHSCGRSHRLARSQGLDNSVKLEMGDLLILLQGAGGHRFQPKEKNKKKIKDTHNLPTKISSA
ncbi:MAG: hypothetical protein P1U67_13640 [Alcanivoracaceae bacterium]|nr:hypothetical protein [Alcanivoracaceae bacterium]